MLSGLSPKGIQQETERLLPLVSQVALRAKLPLLDLALPGLRLMSPAQFQQFRRAVQSLIEMDGELDLFEYVLQKVVMRASGTCLCPAGQNRLSILCPEAPRG
jgi:hypothetical protein